MDRRLVALGIVITSLGLAAPSRASTFVPPCNGSCAAPVLDGHLDPLEYAGGVTYPLSNFASNTANGQVRLQLDGQVLQIGLRLPAPPSTSARGSVSIRLDADRPGTACTPVPEQTGAEDRLLTVDYDLVAHTLAIDQKIGDAPGWKSPAGPGGFLTRWQTTAAFGAPADDPGMIHVELSVRLRPDGNPVSQVLADGVLGFAMVHTGQSTLEHMPGGINQQPGLAAPCSWETLVFAQPPSIPLSVSTWSIGQGPGTSGDEGEGEPEDVGDAVWSRDVVCLNEIGDDADQEAVIDRVNRLRDDHGLPPVTPVMVAWEYDFGPDYLATPDLILSARPVIDSGVFRIHDSLGWGHVLWARILTEAGDPPTHGGGFKAGEFIDVYCTNNKADPEDRGQALDAIYAIVNATRASDRPALLLGKLGFAAGSSEYDEMTVRLEIDQLTPFDQANQWLSDVYDLGTLEPFQLGTDLDVACWWDPTDPFPRTTYAIALPALDTWPTFGVAVDPVASNDNHELTGHNDCVSGHAEVAVDLGLVRVDSPGHYNPLKPHRLTYRVPTVEDHDDSGCCADFYTPFIGWSGGPPGFFLGIVEGDTVHPNWETTRDLSSGSSTATCQVWEQDAGKNDHYDVTQDPVGDPDAFVRVTHANGLVERVDGTGATLDVLGFLEKSPGGFVTETANHGENTGRAVHVVEVVEL